MIEDFERHWSEEAPRGRALARGLGWLFLAMICGAAALDALLVLTGVL